MKNFKVHLRGRRHRPCGSGDVVVARRDETPDVREGNSYTIAEVVEVGTGACQRNLCLTLRGVEGVYSPKTFRVD